MYFELGQENFQSFNHKCRYQLHSSMSEKHQDFEIEPVNTIRPPDIEYTQMFQALVPIDTPLSIIHKHIPRQYDIDKIVLFPVLPTEINCLCLSLYLFTCLS